MDDTFDYSALPMDGVTLHAFDGVLSCDLAEEVRAFAYQHNIGFTAHLLNDGSPGSNELVRAYTTRSDVAMLFKLTFGGAA